MVAVVRMRRVSSAVPIRAVLASQAPAKVGRGNRAGASSAWVRAVQVRRAEASSTAVSLGRVSWALASMASARLAPVRAVLVSSVAVKAVLVS